MKPTTIFAWFISLPFIFFFFWSKILILDSVIFSDTFENIRFSLKHFSVIFLLPLFASIVASLFYFPSFVKKKINKEKFNFDEFILLSFSASLAFYLLTTQLPKMLKIYYSSYLSSLLTSYIFLKIKKLCNKNCIGLFTAANISAVIAYSAINNRSMTVFLIFLLIIAFLSILIIQKDLKIRAKVLVKQFAYAFFVSIGVSIIISNL